MRIFVTGFLCLFAIASSAQQRFECPLVNGKINKPNALVMYTLSEPVDGVYMESVDSLVVAGVAGKVLKTAFIANYYAVLVRADSVTVFVYSGLSSIDVKENDLVTSYTRIGTASRLESGLYELRFILRTGIKSIDPRPFLLCVN